MFKKTILAVFISLISLPQLGYAQALSTITTGHKDTGFLHDIIPVHGDLHVLLTNVEYNGKGGLSFQWVAFGERGFPSGKFTSKEVKVERVSTRSGRPPALPEISTYSAGWYVSDASVVRSPAQTFILAERRGRNRFDGTFKAYVNVRDCDWAEATARGYCDDRNVKTLFSSNTLEFRIKNNRLVSVRSVPVVNNIKTP